MSAAAIRAVLERFTPHWVAPPILQPAAFYLEQLGEGVKARAFLTVDEAGQELCLRPDMTIPACRLGLSMSPRPTAVAYEGLVFRRQAAGSARETEFVQIGLEQLGAIDEAGLVAAALEAAQACGVRPQLRLGHTGVMDALLADLDLHPVWTKRLKALARTGAPLTTTLPKAGDSAIGRALAVLPAQDAGATLAALYEASGITPVGARPPEAVAARLLEKAALRAAPPPRPEELAWLTEALSVDGPVEEALVRLDAHCARRPKGARAQAQEAVAAAAALWAGVKALWPQAQARFAPAFGRGLAFYDGFLFDLEAPGLGDQASLGGGGRYDGLVAAIARDMGVAGGVGAGGFALRPARLALAAEAQP